MGKIGAVAATSVREHPAVVAWAEVSPQPVAAVTRIKRKRRGAVYGLQVADPGGTRVIAKQCDRAKGLVERAGYQEILPRLAAPGLQCYGVVERDESVWLFLEHVGGEPYSPRLPGHRAAAARWIGELQATITRDDIAAHLPDRGAPHYRRFLRSAVEQLHRYRDRGADVIEPLLSLCETIGSSWSRIEALCAAAPEAIVHGDCLSKNVHVQQGRVAVFDWGGAGWGVAATDLGQLALPHAGPPDEQPDAAAYLEAARRRWPQLDMELVRQLAVVGQLFWALKVISRGLEEFEDPWREPEQTLRDLRIYGAALARST